MSSIPPPPPPPPPQPVADVSNGVPSGEPIATVSGAANGVPGIPPPSSPVTNSSSNDSSSQMKVPRKNSNNISSPQDPRSLVSTISTSVIPASQSVSTNKYNSSSSPSKIILPPLNLPKGVSLPPTMDPSILLTSDRAMTLLKELSPSQMQAALNEFDDAMKNKGTKVRNTQAYLVGVIKRYLHVNRKERSSAGAPAMGKDITPVVKVTLQKLIDSNFCTQADISTNVMNKLKMLSEHDALLAINEVASVPRGTIRNFSSYFVGILNRYIRGEETPHKHRIAGVGSGVSQAGIGGVPSYNSMPPNHFSVDDRKDHHGRRARRRDDDRYSDRYRRSRSYDSDYSNDRNRSRRGRRSRRYDDSDDDYSRSSSSERGRRSSRRSRRDRDRSRSSSQDRYKDKHDRRRRFSRSRSRSRSPSRRDRDSHRSSRRSDTSNGAVHPPSVPAGFPGSIPPPPPPRNHQGHPQQWPSSQTPIVPPTTLTNPASIAPQYQNFPPGGAYMGVQSVPALPSDITDILGIAEKAASAVQALTNSHQQSHMQPPPFNSVPPSMSQYAPTPASYPNLQQQNEKPVKITDLTPMIQYSITNLRATGMLDKEIGENACRLLKKMHETVALQALEKFSSCDVSKIRSKEGYLIGILRKAVEK